MDVRLLYDQGLCTFEEYLRLDIKYNWCTENTGGSGNEDQFDDWRDQQTQEMFEVDEVLIYDEGGYDE